jgi:hypothetical protein
MPLIYGEGKRAFLRLQEEIIKRNNDLTIFGWENVSRHNRWDGLVGVLATSPKAFSGSTDLQNIYVGLGPEFSITNRGLLLTGDFKLSYRSSDLDPEKSTYVLLIATTDNSTTCEIGLRKLAPRLYGRLRELPRLRHPEDEPIDEGTIYITTDFRDADDFTHIAAPRYKALHIPKQEHLEIYRVTPQWLWDYSDAMFLQPRQDIAYPYYSSVVAVKFKSWLAGHRDDTFVIYESGAIHPVLHVFSEASAWEHLQDIERLFPALHEERSRRFRGSDYHDLIPEKVISWEDIKREAPWILDKGDSIIVSGIEGRCIIRFLLQSGKLDPYDIPVISLKAYVTGSQSEIDTTQK